MSKPIGKVTGWYGGYPVIEPIDGWIPAVGTVLYSAPPSARKPVAWMYHGILHNGTPHDRPSLIWRPEYMDAMSAGKGAKATPLYTAPPQRKPLTDEEIRSMWGISEYREYAIDFAKEIERAHGIDGGHDCWR
jgi:hypothetical protein